MRRLAPALLLLGAILAVTWPLLAGGFPDQRDLPRFTLPARELWAHAVAAGRLPEWNPFVGLGVATLAAPVHGTFYPLQPLLLVPLPFPLLLGLFFVLHAWIGGAGGYRLARALGCRPVAALCGALFWSVGGYPLSMWGNGEKVLSGAWIPWCALAIVTLARAPRLLGRELAWTALAFAMLGLAGDPFLWLHALLLGVAFAADRHGPLARRVPVALGLAALVAAGALVPAFALVAGSERAGGLAAAEAFHWSLRAERLVELFRPVAARETEWSISLYLGPVAAFALLAGRRALVPLTIAALALTLALGDATPVGRALFEWVPPARMFRYPEKHMLVVLGILATLAAVGVERVLAQKVRPVMLLVLLLPAVASLHAAIVAALLVMVMVVAARPRFAALLPAIVAADLILAGAPLLRWIPSGDLLPPRPSFAEENPPARLYRPRVADRWLATYPDNVGMRWGVAHVPGHDPAIPARLHRLWDAMSPRGDRAVALLRIDHVLLPEPRWHLAASPALPRAQWVGEVEVVPDDRTLARLASPDFPLAHAALVTTGDPLRSPRDAGRCELTAYAAEHVAISCTSTAPGLLVVADADAPGWRARLDGVAVSIERANHVMRGLRVPAGTHRVELDYRTPGLWAGLAASLVGLVVVALLARRVTSPTRGPPCAAAPPPPERRTPTAP